MSNRIVLGLRKEFCEVAESGYVYNFFGDETVSPLDANEIIPAGASFQMNAEGCSITAQVTAFRDQSPC